MFLEFANFYRKFVECYAKITRLLIELLKKSKKSKQVNSFVFEIDARTTFDALIAAFTQTLMFVHFDFQNRILIKTDVLKFAIAAILSQLVSRQIDADEAR